jgi:8-oxo-dGTP diphosphatase
MISPESIRHAIVSTDAVVFVYKEKKLYVLITEVKNKEYAGQNAFPGGLILPNETAEECVKRVLLEKINIKENHIYIEEFGAYSEVNRDVRGRVVSIAYLGLLQSEYIPTESARKFELVEVGKIKKLAYDHDKILKDAIKKLRERFSNSTIASKLLEKSFTMAELLNLYSLVLEKEIDKRNFAKKIKSLDIIEESGGELRGQKHRPAKLFKFKDNKVIQLEIF